MNEKIERMKYRAEKTKKFVKKHHEIIAALMKFALIFGAGGYCGYKLNGKSHTKLIKKIMPDIIRCYGGEGIEAYKDFLTDALPDAMKLINEKCPDDDLLPYYLNRPIVKEAYKIIGTTADAYYKKYRGVEMKK